VKPRLLDLFCGAGGCSVGYARAGFEVVGVDIEPQPNYPFQMIQYDALRYLDETMDVLGRRFDAIHASPPCQDYSTLKGFTAGEYPRLIAPTRALLERAGLPFVIENVAGARDELRSPIRLCGSSFGLRVWRHRYFEMSHPPTMVPPCSHALHPKPLDVTGTGGPSSKPRTKPGGGLSRKPANLAEARGAMGIDWMTRPELSEAVPPAFTEWIGRHLLTVLGDGCSCHVSEPDFFGNRDKIVDPECPYCGMAA
jgi:DNA (cytosine-5)-methyltransferase 1